MQSEIGARSQNRRNKTTCRNETNAFSRQFDIFKENERVNVECVRQCLTYELLKMADKGTKAKIRALNISQIVGYLYSGLVLGVGVPKLNIYMTNKFEEKRKARLAQEGKTEAIPQPEEMKSMLSQDNLAFLKKING